MATSASQENAKKFILACQNAGFRITHAIGTRVTCKANFAAGDKSAYTVKDCDATTLMGMLPSPARSSGSTWGSTSDGVGGAIAIQQGEYVINRSGVDARTVKAIAKLMHAAHQ